MVNTRDDGFFPLYCHKCGGDLMKSYYECGCLRFAECGRGCGWWWDNDNALHFCRDGGVR